MPYLGRQPGVGVRNRYIYTATASQTTFSGADDNGATLAYDDAAYVDVYLNGVLLIPVTDYAATTKTSIVLTSGAAASDLVEILAYEISSIADTVSKANGGTFDGAVTVNGAVTSDGLTVDGNLSVDGGTIKLDGNYPTGSGNVALGDAAGDALTTGGDLNTFVGSNAGSAVVTGDNNTGIGAYAFDAGTGSYNTGVGSGSLGSASNTASYNTAVGYDSLQNNTTGANNVALGALALDANTTGDSNTALGQHAGGKITTASQNTAVGRTAMYDNTTGYNNTAVGSGAGYTNSTGINHTLIGKDAGYSTTGSSNTFVGVDSGYYVSSGGSNTILGRYNGNQGGLDIRTSDNNIVLSDGAGNPRVYANSSAQFSFGDSVAIGGGSYGGTQFTFNADNTDYNSAFHGDSTNPYGILIKYTGAAPNGTGNAFITCGDTSTTRMYVYSNGNIVNQNNSYGALSDASLKENIVDATSQWDDIKALQIRKYSFIADNLDAPNQIGVVAQELESAGMNGLVEDTENKETGDITKQVKYSVLYMKAVKALQEAMERIETLEAKVQALENA